MTRTRYAGKSWRVLVAVLTLGGCATGFDRGALRERLATEPLQVTEQDIKAVRELKPQLRLPFKLGVYLQSESRGPSYGDPSGLRPGAWYWTDADKTEILSWRKRLTKEGIVSDLFLISDAASADTDLKSVRLKAAQHGADAVLIIRGASQVDRYFNPLSLLYLTIVGSWIVPGTNVDALMILQGALWDVGNGYLYATADAEGETKTTGPSMLIGDKNALTESRKKALEDFGAEFIGRLRSLYGT